MRDVEMFFARIDLGLMRTVIIPAVEARLKELRTSELTAGAEQLETAYTLIRLKAAMRENLPGGYIRAPGPEQIANAARHAAILAREEACHGS